MEYIRWTDELNFGIKEIDDQHKKLINIINELHEATSKGEGRAVLESILSALTDYVAVHFASEEEYFVRFNYPEASSHKLEHKAFVDRLTKFQKDAEKGRIMLSLDVLGFLEEWIKGHIKVSDKGYVKCFKEHGLS